MYPNSYKQRQPLPPCYCLLQEYSKLSPSLTLPFPIPFAHECLHFHYYIIFSLVSRNFVEPISWIDSELPSLVTFFPFRHNVR